MTAAPWQERKGSELEHGVERISSTVKEGWFQRGERGQAKRTSLGEVGESMSRCVVAKALQEDLESSDFTPNVGQT